MRSLPAAQLLGDARRALKSLGERAFRLEVSQEEFVFLALFRSELELLCDLLRPLVRDDARARVLEGQLRSLLEQLEREGVEGDG